MTPLLNQILLRLYSLAQLLIGVLSCLKFRTFLSCQFLEVVECLFQSIDLFCVLFLSQEDKGFQRIEGSRRAFELLLTTIELLLNTTLFLNGAGELLL